eukprot:g21727.t1
MARLAGPIEATSAMRRPNGYGERTMLPAAGQQSLLARCHLVQDCPCPACETHRTFHALLRGSEPKPKTKPSRPRRPVAEWNSSEGAPLSQDGEERPALRLMKWKGEAEDSLWATRSMQ